MFSALTTSLFGQVELTLLGPKVYERTTGPPALYMDGFPAVEGPGTLIVTNGDARGNNRISSAVVAVNGVEVLGPRDFNQRVEQIEIELDLLESNVLSVRLRSRPGSFLTIQITQEIEAEAAAVIGPAGGLVEVDNPSSSLDGTTLQIPPLALVNNTVIWIREDLPPAILDVLDLNGPVVEIGPHGLQFNSAVTLSFPCVSCDNGPVEVNPMQVFAGEQLVLFFEDFTLDQSNDGNWFIQVSTQTLSWFSTTIFFPTFPLGTIYYLHSDLEGFNKYPINTFNNQECTEFNFPCDSSRKQWLVNKSTVDKMVEDVTVAAVEPLGQSLQFVDVHDIDPTVDTLQEFFDFLENNGGFEKGLVIAFDPDGFNFQIQGKFGFLVEGLQLTRKVKTVLLADRDSRHAEGLGWRIDPTQPESDSLPVEEWIQQESPVGIQTFSMETILLHEIGHAMGLRH